MRCFSLILNEMNIKKSKILSLKLIYPFSIYKDNRGTFTQVFNKKKWEKTFNLSFVEEDNVQSKKNVFRGIHADSKNWKLVSCTSGKILCIIVNLDKKCKFFGKSEKFLLSNSNFQILIPPNYGNSYLVLSKNATYHYKQTEYYSGAKNQYTYNILDPFFNIKLPVKNIIISKRDSEQTFVKKFLNN
jgi:dTDP-4-dehydrorhamnose 3,5-epimerase